MKGYRTILANIVLAAPLVAELFVDPHFGAVLPDGWQKWYGLAVVVANMYLRTITTTPLGKRL